jgi:cobalamin biosynthesis Mg chelatase CobN
MTQQRVADPSMERSLDPADWTAFRSLSHRMLDLALDHMESVRDRPVWTPVPEAVKAALCEPLPMAPQGAENTALWDGQHAPAFLRLGSRFRHAERHYRRNAGGGDER